MKIESWTVTPLHRPDLDDDPMGVFVVEPAATLLTARYFAAEAETPELDAIHAENAAIGRLLQTAPKLLNALIAASDWIDAQIGKPRAELQAKVHQAIAEATGRTP
jgi:hypothetical protein